VVLLRLIPLSSAAAEVVDALAESVAAFVPWQVEVAPALEARKEAAVDGQMDAREAVSLLPAGDHDTLAVGITDSDLTLPGYHFVFGYAVPGTRAAIVSIHRLHGAPGRDRGSDVALNERATKEILHEAGHLLMLGHCPDPTCVMRFSQTLHDTDIKSERFCARCARELSRLPESRHEG
jgi:predicted Zn-dependent protease